MRAGHLRDRRGPRKGRGRLRSPGSSTSESSRGRPAPPNRPAPPSDADRSRPRQPPRGLSRCGSVPFPSSSPLRAGIAADRLAFLGWPPPAPDRGARSPATPGGGPPVGDALGDHARLAERTFSYEVTAPEPSLDLRGLPVGLDPVRFERGPGRRLGGLPGARRLGAALGRARRPPGHGPAARRPADQPQASVRAGRGRPRLALGGTTRARRPRSARWSIAVVTHGGLEYSRLEEGRPALGAADGPVAPPAGLRPRHRLQLGGREQHTRARRRSRGRSWPRWSWTRPGSSPRTTPVDLQFIGHSEGAVVNTQAIVRRRGRGHAPAPGGVPGRHPARPPRRQPRLPRPPVQRARAARVVRQAGHRQLPVPGPRPAGLHPLGGRRRPGVLPADARPSATTTRTWASTTSGARSPCAGRAGLLQPDADRGRPRGKNGVYAWYQDHVVPPWATAGWRSGARR